MADKFACTHCGFVFEDPDMEVCPRCGTELGQEWDPAELRSFVITELTEEQAKFVATLTASSAEEIFVAFRSDGCFALENLTPRQVEAYAEFLKQEGIPFVAESEEQKAIRLQKQLEAHTASKNAEAEKAKATFATEKAKAEVAAKSRMEQEAKRNVAKAQAQADAKEKAIAEAEKARFNAEKASAEANAKAQADLELKKFRIEQEKTEKQCQKKLAEKAAKSRRKKFYFWGSVAIILIAVFSVMMNIYSEKRKEIEKQNVERIKRDAEAHWNNAIQDCLKKREIWIAKNNFAKKAVQYLQDADLKYPTVKDAVMAASCADLTALQLIKKNGFSHWEHPDIMLAACRTPYVINVQYIHKQGGNINAKDKDGYSALMAACGYVNSVKYLVEHGADVNAKDCHGYTALIYAARVSNNTETVKLLVNHGADINAREHAGYTALVWSAGSANTIETVKYLVSCGADVNACGNDGWTALMAAHGNIEKIKYLVSQGADVNAKNKEGVTTLMESVWIGNFEVTKYLVSKGADPKAKDYKGTTVLMYAVRRSDNIKIVKYLVNQGAEINAVNNDGRTVLYLAKKHKDLYEYLVSQGAH